MRMNVLAKVVLGAKKHVDKVVMVDDGSTDATLEIAEALGALVVRHDENRGYSATLRTCFETARELDADIMVILDSDGQHDPAYIPVFINQTLGKFDQNASQSNFKKFEI